MLANQVYKAKLKSIGKVFRTLEDYVVKRPGIALVLGRENRRGPASRIFCRAALLRLLAFTDVPVAGRLLKGAIQDRFGYFRMNTHDGFIFLFGVAQLVPHGFSSQSQG